MEIKAISHMYPIPRYENYVMLMCHCWGNTQENTLGNHSKFGGYVYLASNYFVLVVGLTPGMVSMHAAATEKNYYYTNL